MGIKYVLWKSKYLEGFCCVSENDFYAKKHSPWAIKLIEVDSFDEALEYLNKNYGINPEQIRIIKDEI